MFAIIGGIYAIANFLDNMAYQMCGNKHTYQLIQ